MRPIILTAPATALYAAILEDLKLGFMEHGCPCAWLHYPLHSHDVSGHQSELGRVAQQHNAQAVFEINRALSDQTEWPSEVAHFTWIQDHRFSDRGDLLGDLGRSDHTYLITDPRGFGIPPLPSDRSWSILLPGANAGSPADMTSHEPERDFAFMGYISPPLELDRPAAQKANFDVISLRAVLERFPKDVLMQSRNPPGAIRSALAATLAELECIAISDDLVRVFDETLPRTIERRSLIEQILSVSQSVDLFGPPEWKEWPQFAAHYRRMVNDRAELATLYRTTRVNLHNGALAMHYRVLECLSLGTFVMVNATPLDNLPGGIKNYLEPGRHYGEYDLTEAASVGRQYLENAEARKRIASEGQRAVIGAHTWAHRAAQILDDLNVLNRIKRQSPDRDDVSRVAAATQSSIAGSSRMR